MAIPEGRTLNTARRLPAHIMLLQLMVAGVAAVLVLALWVAALVTTNIDRDFALRQARTQAATLAFNFEEQVHRQFVLVDQALRILKLDWERAPAAFDFAGLQRRAGSLSDILSQVLIVDARGRVVESTRRDLINANLSDREYVQAQLREDLDKAYVDGPSRNGPEGPWVISISRRLNTVSRAFAGVVVGTIDLGALTRDMAQAEIGRRGIAMLVGRDGIVRALVDQGVREPGDDISASSLFQVAFNAPGGVWSGPSPIDSVNRVHAFRAVPGQDMVLVVGLEELAVLANADARRRQAIWASAAITLLLTLIAIGTSVAVGASHRREMRLARDRAVLANANHQLLVAREEADAKSMELKTTFAGMSDGISMFDREFRLVSWNDRFAAVAGVPEHMLQIGMPLEQIVRAQAEAGEFGPTNIDQEVVNRMALARSRTFTGVVERFRPDGRMIELRRATLPDGGIVTLYTDITARKQAEAAQRRARDAAEQAAEEKSRFVAIVSHEIRTPLNVAVNTFRLLDQSDLPPGHRKLVTNGLHAGEALTGLLNDILDLSRMEVGRLALRPAPFAVQPMLSGLVDMFRPLAAERGIDLSLEVGPGVPERVLTDAGRLRQVLMNFISNASKFAEPGPVQLRATVQTGAGRPELRLAVRDSGPAIPELDRARLFRPFSQLERQPGGAVGAGLGLAICQLLANLLNGDIGCDPVPGEGKEFWLTLPMEQLEVLPEAQPSQNEAVNLHIPRSRVLVVEDMQANQLIAATLLRRDGHVVDLASTGEDALAMVAARPYDLVFMDIFMPGMGGVEATKQIRSMPGYAGRVPVIALTANVSPANRMEYLRSGFQDALAKPVERTALLTAIGRYVWGRRPGAGGRPPPQDRIVKAWPNTLAPVQEPALPLLDKARLSDLRGGLPAGIFANLVESALEDLRERAPLLRQAAANNDPEDVKKIAHAMAGVAGSYGLVGLEARLRQLMTGALPLDMSAPDGAGGVVDQLDRSEQALHQMLQVQAA